MGVRCLANLWRENAAGLNKDLKASVEPIARYPESHELCQNVSIFLSRFRCNVETQFLVPATFLKTQDLEKTTQKWQVEMLAYEKSIESHPKSQLIDGYALQKLMSVAGHSHGLLGITANTEE